MKLTDNFDSTEFDSHDGAIMPQYILDNIIVVANQLQVVRNFTGRSITINSGYRSPAHNESIGGVSNSQHTKGKAADIVVKGLDPIQVYVLLEGLIEDGLILEGGLGLDNNCIHYDCRGKRARWNNSN